MYNKGRESRTRQSNQGQMDFNFSEIDLINLKAWAALDAWSSLAQHVSV